MPRLSTVLAAAIATAAAQVSSVPADVRTRAIGAGVSEPLAAWCPMEVRAGTGRPVAVATRDGRYLVIDVDRTAVELAAFEGAPDLACYSPREARALDDTLQRSEAIAGRIAPRFTSSVVCGFVTATRAVCWQYSPRERAYVEVGGWTT